MEYLPGVLSMIIVVCLIVLVLTGWGSLLFDQSIPVLLIVMMALWLLLSGYELALYSFKINAAWLIWGVVGLLGGRTFLRSEQDTGSKLLIFSHMMILTCCYFILEMERYSGRGFIPIIPLWGYALFAGVVALLSTPTVRGQWMILTFSLWIGEGLIQWRVTGMNGITLGNLSTFDVWWLAFGTARCCAAVIMIFQQFFGLRSSE